MRNFHQYGIDTKGRNSDGKIKNICPQCFIFFVLLNIKKDLSLIHIFNRTFKRHKGVSPCEYKQGGKADANEKKNTGKIGKSP